MRMMIGKVERVEGQVEVVDSRGEHRLLVTGDLLREGDQIVTASGSTFALTTTTGELVELNGRQTITMTSQLTSQYAADASDDAIHPWLLHHVLASVQSGADVLDLSGLMRDMPEENSFAAFAATVLPNAEHSSSLHIEDLIQDHATPQAGMQDSGMIDLIASSGLPSEVALQQSLLKDLIKDS